MLLAQGRPSRELVANIAIRHRAKSLPLHKYSRPWSLILIPEWLTTHLGPPGALKTLQHREPPIRGSMATLSPDLLAIADNLHWRWQGCCI